MPVHFPTKGVHDNKPTPQTLYQIITQELKFADVCLDKTNFNAVVKLWPNRAYCNPPFSKKKLFILRAINSNQAGREVMLYLPFDSTPSWFHMLYAQNVLVMIFMQRMGHAKFPHALFHLKDYQRTQVVLLRDIREVLNYVI
jgi:hypothetical protein